MKDIYELLNNVDEEKIISENVERVELTDMEKMQIMRNVKKQSRNKNRRISVFKKTAAVIALVLCIGVGGTTVGAAVMNYFNDNTKYDYKEDVDIQGTMEGVTITVSNISRVDRDIVMDCRFDFDEDTKALQEASAQWLSEGRNAVGLDIFKNTLVYFDGVEIAQAETTGGQGAGLIIKNITFEDYAMNMQIEFMMWEDSVAAKDHHIVIHFADLNVGDRTIEGEWEYAYDVEADNYDEEIERAEVNISGTDGFAETLNINQYAVTPNGLRLYGTATYDVDGTLRVLAWDDLGNYYLMYKRSAVKGGMKEEMFHGVPYDVVLNLYDGVYATDPVLANRDYKTRWDPDATEITFAIEKETAVWNDEMVWIGNEYEIVSDTVTVRLDGE